MPKVWNIGNTTVRNPKRIENALKVFYKEGFSGNVKGSDQEERLHQALKDNFVLDFDGLASDFNGRKWRAAFYQLGFISYEKYDIGGQRLTSDNLFSSIGIPEITNSYQITPAGNKLINALSVPEIEEIYSRLFICYELPALEKSFPAGRMKPFILFLEVLKILQDMGENGLTKFETGLFLQKFQDHTLELAQNIVAEIISFRQKCRFKSPAELRIIRKEYLDALGVLTEIDPMSITRDYADTTFRYFSLTGIFTRIQDTIVIRANKKAFVDELLITEPVFHFATNPLQYFSYFYKNSYPIPTDNPKFALLEIESLKTGIKNKTHPLLVEANKVSINTPIDIIQKIRFQLIEYNNWEREEDFANEQRNPESVLDILNYLNSLNNNPPPNSPEIDDKPAYLEWAVWRSFLAINNIVGAVHETRRFPVDQDFFPRNTAPGGGSDLIFEFETYVLVVEVTLTTSHRQMSAESEPVRRHAVNYKLSYPDKDVYCLFIAPNLDNNVVETFRIGVWYNGDVEEFVNIIPMTLTDFIESFGLFKQRIFTNDEFKALLDRSLVFRNVRAPQWKSSIKNEITRWKARLLN